LLATAIGVCIEGEINSARTVAQLLKLAGVQMRAQRAGDVAKTRLPQHGIIEQPLDENDLVALLNLVPGIQATLRAVKESMAAGGTRGFRGREHGGTIRQSAGDGLPGRERNSRIQFCGR